MCILSEFNQISLVSAVHEIRILLDILSYNLTVKDVFFVEQSIISKWASLLGLSAEDLVKGDGHRQYLEQNTVMINLYFGSMKEKVVTETVEKGISGFLSE